MVDERSFAPQESENSLEVLVTVVTCFFYVHEDVILCCDTAIVGNCAETELSMMQKEKWLLVEHLPQYSFNFRNCTQTP